jgi:hypothetical protein
MTPRDPVPNAPGAFAVNGPNDVPGGQDDDDNFTYTAQDDTNVDNNIHAAPANPTNPVEARLVDNSDDVENLQEQLRRREQELEQMRQNQENIVVGQVLHVDNDDGDDEEKAEGIHSNNEDPTSSSNNKSMCASKRKVTIALVAILVIVAVVVGIVVAMPLQSPNECIDNLSSWAKGCVTEDRSKFCLDCGIHLVVSSLCVH